MGAIACIAHAVIAASSTRNACRSVAFLVGSGSGLTVLAIAPVAEKGGAEPVPVVDLGFFWRLSPSGRG